jgi:hypothetical protein
MVDLGISDDNCPLGGDNSVVEADKPMSADAPENRKNRIPL